MPSVNETVPQDVIMAEQGVLAAVFDDPRDIDIVSEVLTPHDFAEPRHEYIYRAMLNLHEEGQVPNPILTAARLRSEGDMTRIGGIEYITQLTNPNALYAIEADAVGFALVVQEASRKRSLRKAAEMILEKTSYSNGVDAEEAQAFAEAEIQSHGDLFTVSNDIAQSNDLVDLVIERMEDPDDNFGVPSGFNDLDDMTNGFQPGQLIVIGARPAVGKSTLAADFLRASAIKAEIPSLFVSLEMSNKELMARIISAESKVELKKISKGNLDEEDWDAINDVQESIKKAPLYIYNSGSGKLTVPSIRTHCLRLKAKGELGIVYLDYLQLLSSATPSTNREQEVAQICRSLKNLARELDVPVVILSQLKRGSESASDKRPGLTDLRESGSIEQDADIVFLLHRPETVDPTDRPGQADLIIAKHRNGETGIISLVPLLHIAKFASGTGLVREPEDTSIDTENAPPPDNFDDSFDRDYIPQEETALEDAAAAPAW